MTEQYDEDLTNLTDPTPSNLSEESSLEAAIDDEDDDSDIEPGAEAPEGSGIEGADDILEAERESAEGEDSFDVDLTDELGEDDSAAAEQGNRDGDEMVSEGDDPEEVSELDGDTEDVDALGGIDEDEAADGVDLDGTDGGEDPLSGEALG
jgi:hypothetical protein